MEHASSLLAPFQYHQKNQQPVAITVTMYPSLTLARLRKRFVMVKESSMRI